jgi:hypothetical protein
VNDPFGDAATIEFTEPQPWKPYEVRVRARNNNGPALVEPATVEGRTGEAIPEQRPENFRVVNVGASSATFLWDQVDESQIQGNFTGYKLTYWYDDEDLVDADGSEGGSATMRLVRKKRQIHEASQRKSVIVAPGINQVTVHDLKPNAQNYAIVQVITVQHEGPKSETLTFRTREGVPSPVRELTAFPLNNREQTEKGVVVLRWDRPRSANGRITHFSVQPCRTHGANDEQVACKDAPIEVAANVTELRLAALEFESNYRFRVHAHTRTGQGAPNSADAKTLPEALRLNRKSL